MKIKFLLICVAAIAFSSYFWQVDFPSIGLLPVFDCGDNDFIAYRFSDGKWVKFNIVDEICFVNRVTGKRSSRDVA